MVSMNLLNNYRGQVAVFYALLVPVFLFLGGVGLDLGWYYLNVSRLQNAADAAVLVGANKLIEEHDTFKNKNYKARLVDKFPADNPARDSDSNLIDTTAGDEAALDYAKKNLAGNDLSYAPPSLFSVAQAAEFKDGYTRGNPTVTLTPSLWQDGKDYYYVLHLSENIHHFFIGFLDDMNAGVVAVAKLSKPEGDDGRKIIFHANGGSIVGANDETIKKTSVEINIDKLLKSSASVYATIPSEYSSTPIRDGYEFFRYWTDTPDNGKIIPYAQKLTQANVDDFFATYDTDGDGIVILYAQWRKLESSSTPVTLKFDSNGGTFFDKSTTDSKNIKRASDMDDDETTDPITANKGTPEREGYEFLGWSTDPSADANSLISNYIQDGKQLTKSEVENLFGNNTSVTLYAVWKKIDSTTTEEEVKPHNNKTLWEQMQYLIAKNVYPYYWYAAVNKYGQDPINNRFNNVKVYYKDRTTRNYYAERLDLSEMAHDNKTKIGEQTHYYIDFWQADNNLRFQSKDSRGKTVTESTERDYIKNKTKPVVRIHSLFNMNCTYTARSGYGDDPLYCRIEAEPYVSESTPIRQIVININVDNTATGLRPLFFYYDGPDARKNMSVSESNPGKLDPDAAQPVILNLNADFKGVLWMPDIPVVINGNGHKFEGFIIAKEYRYLDKKGTQVKYSTTGKNDDNYSDNNIRVDDNGNVYSLVAEGNSALALWNNGNNVFGLHADSHFKTFKASAGVNYAYVHYDFDTLELDKTAFYNDLTGELIPLYKKDASGNQVRVTKWEDVNLYGKAEDGTLWPIPKKITSNNLSTIKALTRSSKLKNSSKLDEFRGIVLLDGDDTDLTRDNNPIPLYDEAGNPVYFCEDYVKLTGSYNIFTLDTITEGEHGDPEDSKEFLLTKTKTLNISDTKEWI